MPPDLTVISVEYPERTDAEYEPGVYPGIVVKKFEDGRVRVLYVFEDGSDSTSVLRPTERPEVWIDVSFRAVVSVEEASEGEQVRLFSFVTPERLNVLVKRHSA